MVPGRNSELTAHARVTNAKRLKQVSQMEGKLAKSHLSEQRKAAGLAAEADTKGKGTVVEVVPSTGHVGTTALSFSGDGLRCLSAGEEGRLRLWKL